jgi:hypothetical protein
MHDASAAITVRTVGSPYQPRSNEPLTVIYRLGAGESITHGADPATTS